MCLGKLEAVEKFPGCCESVWIIGEMIMEKEDKENKGRNEIKKFIAKERM